jgi:hypothetical protein
MRSGSVRQFASRLAVASSLAFTIVTVAKPAAATPVDPITGYIYDNILYEQNSNSAPTTPAGYFFNIGLFFTNSGDYTTGSSTYPGAGSPQSLPPAGSTEFNFGSTLYPSMAALHTAYPFGLYTITGSGGSAGTATAYINYRHDYFTNTIPYVTNFSALNGLNPAANFSVNFNSFTPNPHVTEGFTFLTITDVSTGVAVVNDDFLSPTTMSALISAGTLLPDTLYDYELDFSDRLNGYNYGSGSYTTQGFDLRTDGSFTTGATPLPSTWFLMLSGVVGLGFVGFRGRKRNIAARLATA